MISIHLLSMMGAVLLNLSSAVVYMGAYLKYRIRGYIYVFLTTLISLISFSLAALSLLLLNPLLFYISVFTITPVGVPTYLYFRRVFSEAQRDLLDFVYVSILSVKIFDLLRNVLFDSSVEKIFASLKPRGELGSIAYFLEMVFIFGLVIYTVLASTSSASSSEFRKAFIFGDFILMLFAGTVTHFALSNFTLTPFYVLTIQTIIFLLALFFYKYPAIFTLVPLKVFGMALIDLDGNIIDVSFKNPNPLMPKDEEREFFYGLKLLLLQLNKIINDEPVSLAINNREIKIFTQIPDKILTLYGLGIDESTYNYLRFLLEKSNYKCEKFWHNLKKGLFSDS